MRLLTFFICWTAALLTASAKVVKVTLADGTVYAYSSSELAAIDIDNEGMMTITTYEGEQLAEFDADLATIEISDEPVVRETVEHTMSYADTDSKLVGKREMVTLRVLYPSIDPDGQPITQSGVISIPLEIWNHEEQSKGIVLMSHYTISSNDECPSAGNSKIESTLMASSSKLEYIMVESDNYGFGATRRFPQAYLYGMVNAQSNIDMLLAARKILSQYGYEPGKYLFNVGYSAGAFDAAYIMRLADEKYADQVKIDYNMFGAGPMNLTKLFQVVVDDDFTDYPIALAMVIVAYNETGHLNLDYNKVFKPEFVEKIPQWINSKKYVPLDLCDSIATKRLSDIFTPEFISGESREREIIVNLTDEFSLSSGWTPNPDGRIFYFHCPSDDVVPQACGLDFVDFLEASGYTRKNLSWLLPRPDLGVNLLTTFDLPLLEHVAGAVSFSRQTAKIISTWENKDKE